MKTKNNDTGPKEGEEVAGKFSELDNNNITCHTNARQTHDHDKRLPTPVQHVSVCCCCDYGLTM